MTDQFIGQILADKYRIDSVLREGGGLGTVYRATHVSMDKPVTIKILSTAFSIDEKITTSFSQEARTVSRIAHQNVLNVTDFGTDKSGATYIVFEGIDGETVKATIAQEGALSPDRAARIARQTAAALAAAHANNVVHRQLNSGNILLTRATNKAEIAKVMDFGALEVDETDNFSNGNRSETVDSIRKLEYLSPEQNSSVSEPDERSDIYSLGVVFYEMLAGEVPFTADNSMDLLLKQASNPPAPLSSFRKDLPAGIEPIILKALAKNPEMRYQNAAEFINDLGLVSNYSDETDVVVSPVALQANENVRNNMWKTAFVVLAGISLLAISLIYATQTKQTDPTTVLQTDANGQPVQPLNPATGLSEQGAANLTSYSTETMMMGGNSNMMMTMPQQPVSPTADGFGDGYNPWARGVPPPGAPMYQQIPPGGQMVDPNNPNSIFMQDGTVLVPVPVNSNTAVNANVKPAATPSVRPTPAVPANTAIQPTSTPATNPQPTPVKTPAATPAPKPTTQPAKTPAATTERQAQSGKEQDT